jgi:redox-sensitive bicupin YhaK (pirin superfamily)
MEKLTVNEVVSPVERMVGPRVRPLGGLEVNRVWPTARRRLVGPFIFFDHMVRAELPAGVGLDVPPHPHIGLATVTYLFEGEIMHADSLGCRQVIRPGEINWMTAGRGITHSERTTDDDRGRDSVVHGVQTWVALPKELEDCEPAFAHHGSSDLPEVEAGGVRLRILAGEAFGARSGVAPGFGLFYVEARGNATSTLRLAAGLGQRALYIVAGSIDVGSGRYDAGRALVFEDGDDVEVVFARDGHLMLFGGPPLDGERHIYWNFVSSSTTTIARARADWQARRFPPVPGDDDYMTLPS